MQSWPLIGGLRYGTGINCLGLPGPIQAGAELWIEATKWAYCDNDFDNDCGDYCDKCNNDCGNDCDDDCVDCDKDCCKDCDDGDNDFGTDCANDCNDDSDDFDNDRDDDCYDYDNELDVQKLDKDVTVPREDAETMCARWSVLWQKTQFALWGMKTNSPKKWRQLQSKSGRPNPKIADELPKKGRQPYPKTEDDLSQKLSQPHQKNKTTLHNPGPIIFKKTFFV